MKAALLAFAVSTVAVVASSGCGDPLVGDSFRGDRVWTTGATILAGAPSGDLEKNLRLALFFSPSGVGEQDPTKWRELVASGRAIVTPSDDTVNVFEPPSPELLAHDADGRGLGYGLARFVVYADENGDGRWEKGEKASAVQTAVAYLYAPSALPAGTGPVDGVVPEGFTLVAVPQSCGDPPPGPTTPGDCGVPLGARCKTNADCTGGVCLQAGKQPWPAGYCVVAETATTTCRPGDGVFFHRPIYAPIPPGVNGYWIKKCARDEDCLRDGDPAASYRCDAGLDACVPSQTALIYTDSKSPEEIEPFCSRDANAPPPAP